MKLFDKLNEDGNSQEEVVIDSSSERSGQSESTETRLGQEVEQNIVGDEKDTSTSESTGNSSLPSMSGTTNTKEDVSMKDIHEQNEEIISLLKEINSSDDESSSSDNPNDSIGGGMNGVL